jgi:predicted RecB family endonuclease
MPNKENKHDRYVKELVKRIRPEYDDISTHLKLNKKKRTIAEIDIMARKGKEIHFFEVKCSYRIVKARKQLTRLRRLFQNDPVSLYFYCGIGDMLIEIA